MEHIAYKQTPLKGSIEEDELHEVVKGDVTLEGNAGKAPSDAGYTQLSPEEQRAVVNKVAWRIVPFLSFLYVLSYLDRASLSNVHTSLIHDLGMEEDDYANAVGIFFLGYILLGVPSNIALVLMKARVWLCGIMVTWGSLCIVMMFVRSGSELLAVRFFLGCAEAGFVPGVFLYMTYWFLPQERAQQLALFISSNAMAGLLGGLLSYVVELWLEGVWGLHWWQFLFLIEGVSTVVFGFCILKVLPDSPADAKWLTEQEKSFLINRYRANNNESHTISLNLSRGQWASLMKATLTDKYLWVFSIADFCNNGIMITITFFLPVIIQNFGVERLISNLLSAIPYGCALFIMMANAIHSDRMKERTKHIIVPCMVALVFGLGLTATMLKSGASLYLQMFFICVIVSCVWAVK
jgi:MFS family permease